MKTNIMIVIIVAIIAVAAIVIVNSLTGDERNTVSATGNSQLTAEPDKVEISILAQSEKDTAEAAKNKISEITDNVIKGLKLIGISEDEISTENYNIYPQYDWTDGKQRLKGYQASNYIKVKTSKFDLAGKVVDTAVDSGALINYINFELSTQKSNELKTQALAEASKDAKTKAEALASGLDKKLGELVSVSSQDYFYQPYPLFAAREGVAMAEASKVATNLPEGSIDVTAAVSVVYEIK